MYYDYTVDPDERGSKEHAIKTLLRNYHQDLTKITDAGDHNKTIDAMVQRIELCNKETGPIDKIYSKQFRENETALGKLAESDPKLQTLARKQDSLEREWDSHLAPHYKALHKDLDKIVTDAVAPYVERQRDLAKKVDAVGRGLTAQKLAADFKKTREQSRQQRQATNDNERER